MSSQILLYSGVGTGPFCLQAMENQLNCICDGRSHMIRQIDSFDEIGRMESGSVKALVVPGGNAGVMSRSLFRNDTFELIKNLIISNGISYYGACAGAIFASQAFHGRRMDGDGIGAVFSHPTALLGLYPGKIVAPILSAPPEAKLFARDFKRININIGGVAGYASLMMANIFGPGFLDCDTIEGAEILSSYRVMPPLQFKSGLSTRPIVSVIDSLSVSESVFYQGGGRPPMVLTGSHPEVDSAMVRTEAFKVAFNTTNDEQWCIAEEMAEGDGARKILLKGYFEKIGIACRP